MPCSATVNRLMYRHFAFKPGSSLTEELLASEEEPMQVFGLLGYRPNLSIFIIVYKFFFHVDLRPIADYGLFIHEVSRSHTTTHHVREDFSGRVISSSQRPLPDKTQHKQQTNIHAPGGIRTHYLSKREGADLHLRPRGHWDRLLSCYLIKFWI